MGAPKCPSETRLSAAIENDTRSRRHISAGLETDAGEGRRQRSQSRAEPGRGGCLSSRWSAALKHESLGPRRTTSFLLDAATSASQLSWVLTSRSPRGRLPVVAWPTSHVAGSNKMFKSLSHSLRYGVIGLQLCVHSDVFQHEGLTIFVILK